MLRQPVQNVTDLDFQPPQQLTKIATLKLLTLPHTRSRRTNSMSRRQAPCQLRSNPQRIASRISAGDAVPVPFFMIVMEATRFPKRAASIAEPVTASATAAPAEKL